VLRRRKLGSRRLFFAASSACLVLLLSVGAISDVGTAYGVWRGPSMYAGVSYMFEALKLLIPTSLLAGILALVKDRLNRERLHPAAGNSPPSE
jgi:hypothetical protein